MTLKIGVQTSIQQLAASDKELSTLREQLYTAKHHLAYLKNEIRLATKAAVIIVNRINADTLSAHRQDGSPVSTYHSHPAVTVYGASKSARSHVCIDLNLSSYLSTDEEL